MKSLFIILATIILVAITLVSLMTITFPVLLLMAATFPVVLSAILLVGIPLSVHDKKSHTTGMDLVFSGAHTLSVPGLGLTMADGGEKVGSSEARAGVDRK